MLQDYAGLLADLPSDLTQKAIYNLGRTLRWFPKASEIRDEVSRLMAAAPKAPGPGEELLHVRLHREAKAWTKSFMSGDLGRQAKAEGWSNKLSGYMLSLTYQRLLKAHQTGEAPDLPSSVPDEVIERYRAMYPPLTRKNEGEIDPVTGKWTMTI